MRKFILTFFLTLSLTSVHSIEAIIVHNIQDEIITNIDIKNEFKYLLALNNSLKELNKEKIFTISNESIIREKIKKIELLKNFKEIEISDQYSDLILKNIYSRLSIQSLDEFEIYLQNYDLILSDVIKKITIDAMWNELIIQKYTSQVVVDEIKIQKEIKRSNKKIKKEYQLSEIIFEIKNKEEIQKKYNEIIKSINQIGFKNSASIYSFSESAKIGGDIGWFNESSINKKIRENIEDLKIGGISKPITLSNGILLLKVMNTKNSKIEIDYESEFKKAVDYERNRQFSQYSKIYFNKIKKNLKFND